MSGTSVNSLEDVYKKWEKKGEERRKNPPRNLAPDLSNGGNVVQPGRSAWAQRFEGGGLPKRRTSRRKNQVS